MSKDVRRLFAAQKAAKAASSLASSASAPASLSSSGKRVTHPLAKYDPNSFRLTCAICGPSVPIRSDSLWNAHLVSKAHQDAVAKLRAVKEQMQKREAEAAERARLQQQQQAHQAQVQGVKRKAPSGLVAYADDSESESEDDTPTAGKQSAVTSESKRVKVDDGSADQDRKQVAVDIEEEEDTMAGLPAGFFDSGAGPSPVSEERAASAQEEDESMDGVLPAGFFDDPEEDARIRAEVGGATADKQQRQVDEEFKVLQAELAREVEQQEQQEAAVRSGQVSATVSSGAQAPNEHIPYDEKVEQEEQELEESVLARSEEEYRLFVEMQERLDALREKKCRLLAHQPSPSLHSAAGNSNTKTSKKKNKSILDLVREQEKAKKEKERLAAEEFAKLSAASGGDSKMANSDEDSDDDDEDIEAMMDWRARRV